MNIFMLSWEYPPKIVGGISRHVQDLSKALTNKGHDVRVFTGDVPNIPPVRYDDKVLVYTVHNQIPPSMDFLTWVQHLNFNILSAAIPLMNNTPADIIHVHDWLTMYAGRVLKFAYKKPLVATIHATEYGRNNGLHNPLQRYISDMEWTLAYEAWRVICCSDIMKDEIRRIFQVPEDKIEIVPNGVDPANFIHKGLHQRSHFAADDERIVFFIGRLVQQKGVEILLDAIPAVLAAVKNAKFIIAGTGPLGEYLKERARQLDIYHRIYFTGYIDDTTRNFIYQHAEISVFPSLYEPFGIVALESMAAKTPLIVSDTGGLASIVRHGENGLKCKPGDARDLAEQIIWALNHRQEMLKMAQNAWRSVKTLYHWPSIAEKTVKIYKKILSEYKKSGWSQKPAEAKNKPGMIFHNTGSYETVKYPRLNVNSS